MGKLSEAIQIKSGSSNAELSAIKNDLLKGETKRLNCDVPANIYKKFQQVAIEQDTSITEVVNKLVLEYINQFVDERNREGKSGGIFE